MRKFFQFFFLQIIDIQFVATLQHEAPTSFFRVWKCQFFPSLKMPNSTIKMIFSCGVNAYWKHFEQENSIVHSAKFF